jgi:hypothetical protein
MSLGKLNAWFRLKSAAANPDHSSRFRHGITGRHAMLKPRRRFRTLPPGQAQVEASEWISSLSMDDLLVVEAIVIAELAHRTGREKYRIPPHVAQMLN